MRLEDRYCTYVCTLPCASPVCTDLCQSLSSSSQPAQQPHLKFQRRQKQEVLQYSLLPLKIQHCCSQSQDPDYHWFPGAVLGSGSGPGSYQQHSQQRGKMTDSEPVLLDQCKIQCWGAPGVKKCVKFGCGETLTLLIHSGSFPRLHHIERLLDFYVLQTQTVAPRWIPSLLL